jgi:hypothetical protein
MVELHFSLDGFDGASNVNARNSWMETAREEFS